LLLTLAVVPLPASAQGLVGPAYVTRVVAGDTVYAEVGGRLEVIRYLGVNSPLIEHPTRGADAYADAVREINRQLVEGRWIRLGFDDQPRDRYGRLLAYVWVGNLFVNAAMIHYGYGEAAASTTSTRYGEYFRTLEVGARQDARGLWRDPEALTYHRPRPAERESAGDYEERAADASGGRVFSAPAPFIPAATPTSSVPTVGVPGGPVAPRASPSYIPPGGVTRPR
jgi:micrococcal nuclease